MSESCEVLTKIKRDLGDVPIKLERYLSDGLDFRVLIKYGSSVISFITTESGYCMGLSVLDQNGLKRRYNNVNDLVTDLKVA